jgi:hypothetical protein
MPILLCAVLSLAVAWIRGASPARLASIQLRWLVLPVLTFAAQAIAFGRFGPAITPYATLLQIATNGALLAFLIANLRYRALTLVILGTALNLAVNGANGGYMPVRPADVARAGFPQVAARLLQDGHFEKSAVLDERTRLPWLADVIYLPLPKGPGRMLSIGDLFVAAGVFLFVQEALIGQRRAGPPAAGALKRATMASPTNAAAGAS